MAALVVPRSGRFDSFRSIGDVRREWWQFFQAIAQLRCNICSKDQTFSKFTSTLAMPIDAQIKKSGKEYTLNVRMGGDEGTWRKIATVISINPPVRPVMFARQRAETKGQSAFRIDHFRIDAAK